MSREEMLPAQTHSTRLSRARRLLQGVALLVVALAATLLTTAPRSSAAPDLGDIRAKQDSVQSDLDQQNAAINSILAQAGRLREQQDQVAEQLTREQGKLTDARGQLAASKAILKRTKHQLVGARKDLTHLLVYLYESGQIDETQVLLDANGLDDLATRSEYLRMINEHQTSVATRFHDLSVKQGAQVDASKRAVSRIAKAKKAIEARSASLAASQSALASRKADLRSARAAQRQQLIKLAGQKKNLIKALSTPAPETQTPDNTTAAPTDTESPDAAAPANPVAAPSGSQATINPDGTATAPANAPQAVKDVIAAGNQIANTPYVYGGGHGSFDSSGYDCSGSVSYALHGGGFLDAPLDSTGFEGWGDAGPGNWITVYANAGHAYMEVAGLRYDTSGASPSRWQTSPPYPSGFVVRHPPGY